MVTLQSINKFPVHSNSGQGWHDLNETIKIIALNRFKSRFKSMKEIIDLNRFKS